MFFVRKTKHHDPPVPFLKPTMKLARNLQTYGNHLITWEATFYISFLSLIITLRFTKRKN